MSVLKVFLQKLTIDTSQVSFIVGIYSGAKYHVS